MNVTDIALLQKMKISEAEIERRKELIGFTSHDIEALIACSHLINEQLDGITSEFYRMQISVTEIALLINDSETLSRLHVAQRRYITDIFSGVYDLDYVNNRLIVGIVHKRIGVEPKLYLSAVYTLKSLLHNAIYKMDLTNEARRAVLNALEKIITFDVTLIFETYLNSLMSELEVAKNQSDRYAQEMEIISETDPLTGLLNSRNIYKLAASIVSSAQSRGEPVTFLFIDVDDFKKINDTQGHHHGDEVLRVVGLSIKSIIRDHDRCFRYGGDEFCVILSNCSEESASHVFTDRLNKLIKEKLGDVSLSVGVAQTGPEEYLDAPLIIQKADENMYIRKRAKKQKG